MKHKIEKVNNWILDPTLKKVEVEGRMINVTSVRLRTFATKGTDCICCGIKGSHYRVDHNDGFGHHFNLYAVDKDGKEVLMTRDHIQCASHGGPDTVENMNPMCRRCNTLRGNSYELEEFLRLYKSGKLPKAIDRPDVGMTNTELTSKLRDSILEHVEKFGLKSNIYEACRNHLNKHWKRQAVIDRCNEEGDELGAWICTMLDYRGSSTRSKTSKWFTEQFPLETCSEDHSNLSIEAALGILLTRSRAYLENPSDHNEARLRSHMAVSKRSIRGSNSVK